MNPLDFVLDFATTNWFNDFIFFFFFIILIFFFNLESLLKTPYFVYPWFACQTPKIPKILSSLHGVTGTSRLMWRNPFGHWSTWSAIFRPNWQECPWSTLGWQSQNWVKVIQKQYLSCFYIKPELLSDFRQLWLSLTWGWLLKGIEVLILIQPSKRFGTSAIAKIIKFPFQQLFMG